MSSTFPWLGPDDYFKFPSPENATVDGIVASGGNLSPGMLISAYAQGIFPWFNEDEPLLWWSPDPRFVLFPDKIHVSRSMKKLFKKKRFHVTFNTDFESVIKGCRNAYRPEQEGTWITDEMENAYQELYNLGLVLSVEVREKNTDDICAGLYGVLMGKCFFGESMFSSIPNGSKYGFITAAEKLKNEGIVLIDCQVYTEHLESLGAEMISRTDFLETVKRNI